DNCKCRKPKAGLIDAIEEEFNVSAEGVPFIGDTMRDLQAGAIKGCKPILVKTGNGLTTLSTIQDTSATAYKGLPQLSLSDVHVFEHLAAAADYLINPDNEIL